MDPPAVHLQHSTCAKKGRATALSLRRRQVCPRRVLARKREQGTPSYGRRPCSAHRDWRLHHSANNLKILQKNHSLTHSHHLSNRHAGERLGSDQHRGHRSGLLPRRGGDLLGVLLQDHLDLLAQLILLRRARRARGEARRCEAEVRGGDSERAPRFCFVPACS